MSDPAGKTYSAPFAAVAEFTPRGPGIAVQPLPPKVGGARPSRPADARPRARMFLGPLAPPDPRSP